MSSVYYADVTYFYAVLFHISSAILCSFSTKMHNISYLIIQSWLVVSPRVEIYYPLFGTLVHHIIGIIFENEVIFWGASYDS